MSTLDTARIHGRRIYFGVASITSDTKEEPADDRKQKKRRIESRTFSAEQPDDRSGPHTSAAKPAAKTFLLQLKPKASAAQPAAKTSSTTIGS